MNAPEDNPPSASDFRAHFRWQAGWCNAIGSPFNSLLCDLIADRLDSDSPLGQRLQHWPGNMNDDALALRVAGGLHYRVRSADAPALAALYPPHEIDADKLWEALEPELQTPGLLYWLDSAPQTNEVARSAVLTAGFLTIVKETGLPLGLLELGCSAGLNLLPDRYHFRLGKLDTGDLESPLTLKPRWVGLSPPDVKLPIVSRVGVDRDPPDISDWQGRTRMLAYVWADQFQRLDRMAIAMALACENPPEIVTGDAADFVESRVRLVPGVATTVFHSIAYQYFSATGRQRIADHMEKLGAQATAEAPLAWLRFEQENPGESEPPTLRLRLWPDGRDRRLALAHPHGGIVSWL